jgi:hypothetical protein
MLEGRRRGPTLTSTPTVVYLRPAPPPVAAQPPTHTRERCHQIAGAATSHGLAPLQRPSGSARTTATWLSCAPCLFGRGVRSRVRVDPHRRRLSDSLRHVRLLRRGGAALHRGRGLALRARDGLDCRLPGGLFRGDLATATRERGNNIRCSPAPPATRPGSAALTQPESTSPSNARARSSASSGAALPRAAAPCSSSAESARASQRTRRLAWGVARALIIETLWNRVFFLPLFQWRLTRQSRRELASLCGARRGQAVSHTRAAAPRLRL